MDKIDVVRAIIAKREGRSLDASVIRGLVSGYTAGDIPDYQMSAFLMAALLRGLDSGESTTLTEAMLNSGSRADLSSISGIKVDKHSTGGVGDKISICLAPLVASCGVPVPMMSGRGLGHSGGTVDKLESIPGFRTDLSLSSFRSIIEKVGLGMIAQTSEIAPADRKLYALRDVTGTVEFAPFITSSIMSKKLAEGIDGLVLDVKCGSGAFMRTRGDATELAEMLVSVGKQFGKTTVALITRMDAPLGYAVGNWPEVYEAVQCLKGEIIPDVTALTLELAAEMLTIGGVVTDLEAGRKRAAVAIRDGSAFETLQRLVEAQGGDASALDQETIHAAGTYDVYYSGNESGFIAAIDPRAIGYAALAAGAGRASLSDVVDPAAGIIFSCRVGDPVAPGDRIAVLRTNRTGAVEQLQRSIAGALRVAAVKPTEGNLFIDRIS